MFIACLNFLVKGIATFRAARNLGAGICRSVWLMCRNRRRAEWAQ